MLVVTWTIILCNFLEGNCAFYDYDRTSLINGQDFIQVAPNLIISMQEISLGLSCAYLHNGFCWSQFNCLTRIWVHTHSSGWVPLNPLSFLEETNHKKKKKMDHLVVKNSEIFSRIMENNLQVFPFPQVTSVVDVVSQPKYKFKDHTKGFCVLFPSFST